MVSLFGNNNSVVVKTKNRILNTTFVQPPTIIYKNTPVKNEISNEISRELTNSIEKINNNYISNLLTRNYESIPTDETSYLSLYNSLLIELEKTKDKNTRILINMTLSGLKTSLDTQNLYRENQNLIKNNEILTQRIDDVLSNKNNKNVMSSTSGKINMEKSFKLSPMYSYYITMYGLPEYGKGFDEKKLEKVKKTLESMNIDPYQ